MAADQFEILISGSTSSTEDWRCAMNAPESELPQLDEEQKTFARKFNLAESEYARGVLVRNLGENRQRRRGEKLGYRIISVLAPLGSDYNLKVLSRQGLDAWIGRIEEHGRVSTVRIPIEIADQAVDLGDAETMERLKGYVFQGLGVSDLSAAS